MREFVLGFVRRCEIAVYFAAHGVDGEDVDKAVRI
jgi:hypothetical protein